MKKIIIVGVLSLLFVGGSVSSAKAQVVNQDITSLQATLLQVLETLVAQLTAQLQTLLAAQTSGTTDTIVSANDTDVPFIPVSMSGMTITSITPSILSVQDVSFGPYARKQIKVYGSNLCNGTNLCTDSKNTPFVYVNNQQVPVDAVSNDGTSLTFTAPAGVTLNAVADSSGTVHNSLTFSIGGNWKMLKTGPVYYTGMVDRMPPTNVINFTVPVI